MARKKKQQAIKSTESDEFIYCDNRECADFSCQRWIKHAHFDQIIRCGRFQLDKNGNCKQKI